MINIGNNNIRSVISNLTLLILLFAMKLARLNIFSDKYPMKLFPQK